MASSSSNQYVTVEVGEQNPYPYPSHVCAPNFVTFKLSGRDEYGMWKTQMLGLLESHDMLGFIDGTLLSPETSSSVSGKEKVGEHQTHYRLWRRSDALVKGWILGSLSKQTLTYVTEKLNQERKAADFCAKDAWDELQTMYAHAPAVVPPELPVVEDTVRDRERADVHQELYEAILRENWSFLEEILVSQEVTVSDKITNNGNTVLHVAVSSSKNPEFLEKVLGLTLQNIQLLDVKNADGSTLLHVAAIIGNTEAAKILVAKNRDLLFAEDNEGHTPLYLALSNMHTETARLLLEHIKINEKKDTLFSGTSGDELLVTVISSKDFRKCLFGSDSSSNHETDHFIQLANFGIHIELANDLAEHYTELHSDAVLMAIAQNFPSELNILDYIGTAILGNKVDNWLHTITLPFRRCFNSFYWALIIFVVLFFGFYLIFRIFLLILWMLVWPFVKERVTNVQNAWRLLRYTCDLTKAKKHSTSYHHYYTNPLLEATRQNSYDVVFGIVYDFPIAILSANEDGHNIIQYAVINRSEKVYNLLYQMSEHRNIYRTIKDPLGNNLLHLAARLAPSNKLNLISGAALQIQRELQWYKEVEEFVCPLSIIQKNSSGEKPQMVFTREHKDLVVEGEKWMKSTAESYTITAALIITIVFAAAITVPGGSNQNTGIPIFTNNTAFTIFAISDAISLFSAVTSLLMFLSILTARFAEQDFLFKLPTKLIIGLTTLFISTTAMIVAFSATLFLVFGQGNSRILIPIAVLTCLPITSFVTMQFPLVLDLMSATYGRSIFGKKRDEGILI